MVRKSVLLFVLAGLAWATPASAQKIVTLPPGSWATDITPDGSTVVGTYDYADGFIWRWREDPTPTVILGGTIEAVSDDGTVVAGNIIDPVVDANVAAIWTQATGWQSLGWLPTAQSCPSRSTCYDMSGDGMTVVGLSWVGCNARGFRWTAATGMQELQNLGIGNNRCSAISEDGSTMGGFAQIGGFIDRSPAYWETSTAGSLLDSSLLGEVAGFNNDGSVSVGTRPFSGNIYLRAYARNKQTGVTTNLGAIHSNWASVAQDISEDGKVVVGYDYISLAREAWVWTPSDGVISLNKRLTALGVTGAPTLLACRAVSDDGNVVVGGGLAASGFDVAFIAEFETTSAQWTKLGSGLAGTFGLPKAHGVGDLTPGSATAIVLSNGKRNGLAAVVVGLAQVNAPFKQGVLVPSPDLLFTGLPVSSTGSMVLPFTWPAGLPVGFSAYWQIWMADTGGPAGFCASNGLKTTTP